jgi:four helix bundle protein
MGGKFLKLNDVFAYKKALLLSNYVWNIVIRLDYFSKKTVGEQFIRSTDSISANIAEGFGRYNKKDKIKFYRYGFASIKETLDWNQKSKQRNLITEEEYNYILNCLNDLQLDFRYLIKFTNSKLQF